MPLRRAASTAIALLCLLVPSAAAAGTAERAAVFAGTGVWVDIYDAIIDDPAFIVGEAVAHDIDVIYIETSNYRSPRDVMFPEAVREVIRLARPAGIRVVPWYLPGYRDIPLDRRRFRAAVEVGGAELPVDGLGVDIEADIVPDRQLRARRAAEMVQWLRATYPELPMAGIVPRDALAWWRIFPYAEIRANTDVMMPMCYTSRYLTARQTRAMAADCVETVRRETGDPSVPVHVIGGVTDFLSTRQLVAAARGARAAGAAGFSLYNLETTTASDWRAIDVFRGTARRQTAAASAAPIAPARSAKP
jgi:hypothetical protein